VPLLVLELELDPPDELLEFNASRRPDCRLAAVCDAVGLEASALAKVAARSGVVEVVPDDVVPLAAVLVDPSGVVAVDAPVVVVGVEPSVGVLVAAVDDGLLVAAVEDGSLVAADVEVSPVDVVAVDPLRFVVPEAPVVELGSVVEPVVAEAGVVLAAPEGMNSAKIVVVVVVDGEVVAIGPAALGSEASWALLSSDQSIEPLPLPSTLAKADAA
jgi:hypothetical protein